jgi:hypothetical protein
MGQKEMKRIMESWKGYVTSEPKDKVVLKEQPYKVRGYIKPDNSFFTIEQWGEFVNHMLYLQRLGQDTRGNGANISEDVRRLVMEYFSFQHDVEVPRYDSINHKYLYGFIEDFVNHRFWSFQRNFGHFFPEPSRLRFAYFYSRGDLEPYVLLDEELTTQLYGSTWNPKKLCHYTTHENAQRIQESIDRGMPFDISCFTIAARPFFRPESSVTITVRAGFRSDIKSFAVDTGRRCANLLRMEYPGRDKNNLCYELDSCDGELRTSLWNEYIATPISIESIEEKYSHPNKCIL